MREVREEPKSGKARIGARTWPNNGESATKQYSQFAACTANMCRDIARATFKEGEENIQVCVTILNYLEFRTRKEARFYAIFSLLLRLHCLFLSSAAPTRRPLCIYTPVSSSTSSYCMSEKSVPKIPWYMVLISTEKYPFVQSSTNFATFDQWP